MCGRHVDLHLHPPAAYLLVLRQCTVAARIGQLAELRVNGRHGAPLQALRAKARRTPDERRRDRPEPREATPTRSEGNSGPVRRAMSVARVCINKIRGARCFQVARCRDGVDNAIRDASRVASLPLPRHPTPSLRVHARASHSLQASSVLNNTPSLLTLPSIPHPPFPLPPSHCLSRP